MALKNALPFRRAKVLPCNQDGISSGTIHEWPRFFLDARIMDPGAPLHARGAGPLFEWNQGGQRKGSSDLRTDKKHYHLTQIFDKIKPIGIAGHTSFFFQKNKYMKICRDYRENALIAFPPKRPQGNVFK